MTIRSRIKNLVSPYPSLFLPLYRFTARPGFKHLAIGPATEIVIEGFPRSANTFAVVAFEQAQPKPVAIAHHTHAEAQIIAGVRRGLPVLVLIRQPEDAIRSLRVMEEFQPDKALQRWIAFYRTVEHLKQNVIVAEFDRVTSQMGDIIGQINARFGTDFTPCEDSADRREEVFARIDAINASNPVNDASGLARPSEGKANARRSVDLDFNQELLAEARALFQRLVAD